MNSEARPPSEAWGHFDGGPYDGSVLPPVRPDSQYVMVTEYRTSRPDDARHHIYAIVRAGRYFYAVYDPYATSEANGGPALTGMNT